jgi:hypothetical protein
MDVLQGYLTKLYAKEGWRMRSWEMDDYVQEGMAQYLHIERYYHDKAIKPDESAAAAARRAVGELLATGHHYTLAELVAASGATEVSIRTALSDLKNPKYCSPFLKPLPIVKNDDGTYSFSSKRQPKEITEAKHIMALFKTHWSRYIHDHSKKELPDEVLHAERDMAAEDEGFDSLEWLESEAAFCGIEQESALQHLTGDAQALVSLFTSPGEVLTDLTKGIAFTIEQASAIAEKLEKVRSGLTRPGMTAQRVYSAAVEVFKEFGKMPTGIQLLATATGLIQQTHEKREPYLIRLMQGVSQLKEEAWTALPEDAKAAFNSMAAAHNDGKPLTTSTPGAEETPEAIKTTRAGNGGRKATPRPPSGAPAVVSPTGRARVLMVLDEALTPTQVLAKLTEEGFKPPSMATLHAMRSESKFMLRILREHGLLSDPNSKDVAVETPAQVAS